MILTALWGGEEEFPMFEFQEALRITFLFCPPPLSLFPNKRLFVHALVVATVLCNEIESDIYVFSDRLREMIDGIENINSAHEEEEKEEKDE